MGKVVVKARMWNLRDEDEVQAGRLSPVEEDALVDPGAVNVVIGEPLAQRLELRRDVRRARVRYADGRLGEREVALGLRIEIQGRATEVRAIIEPEAPYTLLGQIVLEDMDLLVDLGKRRLVPRPESPDMPLLDLL